MRICVVHVYSPDLSRLASGFASECAANFVIGGNRGGQMNFFQKIDTSVLGIHSIREICRCALDHISVSYVYSKKFTTSTRMISSMNYNVNICDLVVIDELATH